MKKFFILLTYSLLILSFEKIPQNHIQIIKLQNLPLKKNLISKKFQKFLTDDFTYRFIEPFIKKRPEFNKSFIKREFKKFNFKLSLADYPNALKYGIVIKNAYLKLIPLDKKFFLKNFPFDISQSSTIYYSTPVFITEFTKDKKWCYVESYIASGWIKTKYIAFVDKNFIEKWFTGRFVTPVKDKIPIYDRKGKIVDYAYIGSQFPLKYEFQGIYVINIVKKSKNRNAIVKTTWVSKKLFKKKPLKLTYENIGKIANELTLKPYGWGGANLNRDCSMTIRDLFAPFDIYLPRNSLDQINFVNYEDSTLIPYLTLIWFPSHIMLYVGKINGKKAIFHNFWRFKSNVYGKSMITPMKKFIDGKRIKIRNVIPVERINLFR